MAMTYDQLNTYLQTLLVDQEPSPDYTTILPAAIQDAEQRIYRDMDFIDTRTVQSPTNFVAGNREFALPTANVVILVVQGVSAITPQGATLATGVQVPLEPVSLDYIDFCFPNPSVQGVPSVWAMKDAATIIVGQVPDQGYNVAITGTFRPVAMSVANQETYIGDTYPDLLVAACMVFMTGYQRDFGAQSDDPKMAVSWDAIYASRFKSAYEEEQRRKGASVGWTPFQATPLAEPART